MIRPTRVAALLSLLIVMTGCAGTPTASPTTPAAPAPSATVPSPSPSARTTADRVSAMSVRDRVASVLILHSAGTDATALSDFVEQNHPGGLIFMGDNVGPSVADVAALTATVLSSDPPRILAVDQEGGDVSRLPGDTAPAGRALAGIPVDATASAFATRAQLVSSAGLNTNFGIVADITADPNSFIASRVLGTDPSTSAARVAAAVTAEREHGVISTLKHFPGHGAAPGDSHTSLPTTDLALEAWRTTDAVPFAAGIDAGAEMVMMGHLIFAAVDDAPASLSPTWHSILRDDLGFEGVIVSDDLGMLENSDHPDYADRVTNAVAALNAGTTMLVIVADGPTPVSPADLIDGIDAAVEDGRLPEATLNAAAVRAWDLRATITPAR